MGKNISVQDLISIIVPVYNKANAIDRCIQSVFAQSYSNWELLLVNDGSTDASGVICDKYAAQDSRIRVFHKPNGGVSSARNHGISRVSGDWLLFLDADDYLLPNALITLITQAVNSHTLLTCANYYAEKDGVRTVYCTGILNGIISNNFRAWYFGSICLRAGATLFHRSIVNEKMYDEKLSRGEDVASCFNLMRTQKVAYTNKRIMVYSLDNKGLSARCGDRYKDHVFHLTFKGKSFWEKMEMGATLNGAFDLYPEFHDELLSKYKDYMIYTWLDCKIRRFKKYKRNIYNLLFQNSLK